MSLAINFYCLHVTFQLNCILSSSIWSLSDNFSVISNYHLRFFLNRTLSVYCSILLQHQPLNYLSISLLFVNITVWCRDDSQRILRIRLNDFNITLLTSLSLIFRRDVRFIREINSITRHPFIHATVSVG